MVKEIRSWLALLLFALFGLLSQQAWSDDKMVRIFPQQVMLGERVTLSISGDQAMRDFDKLDLSTLQSVFAIHDIDASSDSIRLRLYPLSAGLLKIPQLKIGALTIPATPIKVEENPEVSIDWTAPPAEMYGGQNSLWKATVKVDNEAYKVSYQAQPNRDWHIQFEEQPVVQSSALIGGKTAVLVANYQPKTQLLLERRQQQLIHSPAVEVKNRSNRRWLFFDQPQTVKVKALPGFLPINMPLGQLSLQTQLPHGVKVSGDLNYWVWQLQGRSVDSALLKNVAHQLIAQIAHDPAMEWLTESRESQMALTEHGLNSQLTVRVPFRLLTSGLVNLPELQLRYFDSDSGKVVSQVVESEWLWVVPAWLMWVLQWSLLIVGLLVLYALLWLIKQAWLNWKLRQSISQAQSAQQLIAALFAWQQQQSGLWRLKSTQRHLSRPVSLQQFKQWYEQVYGRSAALEALTVSLNQSLYAAPHQNSNSSELQQLAQAWCQALPLLPKLGRAHRF